MIPGPDIFKKCPFCETIMIEDSLTSGNTFGAAHWSDGKVDAEMMPDFPEFVGCPSCDNFFWIQSVDVVGKYDWFQGEDNEMPEEWKKAERVKKPEIEDYIKALNQGKGDAKGLFYRPSGKSYMWLIPSRAKCLRIRLWWDLNDLIRYEEKQTELFQSYKDVFLDNLYDLSTLLDEEDFEDQIMCSEIFRELGKFEISLDRLLSIPGNYKNICDQLKIFIQLKSRTVQRLNI